MKNLLLRELILPMKPERQVWAELRSVGWTHHPPQVLCRHGDVEVHVPRNLLSVRTHGSCYVMATRKRRRDQPLPQHRVTSHQVSRSPVEKA